MSNKKYDLYILCAIVNVWYKLHISSILIFQLIIERTIRNSNVSFSMKSSCADILLIVGLFGSCKYYIALI